jgi:hypothetical protein
MKAENTELGLMAISLDDSEDNIMRFARMKYDGHLCLYTPDCSISISDFIVKRTKQEAIQLAKRLSYPASHVQKVGNAFCSGWGIRHDYRDNYFFANYE